MNEADETSINWTFPAQPNTQVGILADGKSTDATWTLASGTGTLYEHTSDLTEMCPICIILLETAEGIELFAKYMLASIQVASDGKGNVTSTTGWKCEMCGASGVGKVPEFHEKQID